MQNSALDLTEAILGGLTSSMMKKVDVEDLGGILEGNNQYYEQINEREFCVSKY